MMCSLWFPLEKLSVWALSVLAAYPNPNNTQHLILSPKSLSVSFSAKSIYSSTLQQFKLEDYSLVHTIQRMHSISITARPWNQYVNNPTSFYSITIPAGCIPHERGRGTHPRAVHTSAHLNSSFSIPPPWEILNVIIKVHFLDRWHFFLFSSSPAE